MTTLTHREFDENLERAKEAAAEGPVFIAERGKRTLVLLSLEDYQQIEDGDITPADASVAPSLSDIDLDSELQRPKNPPQIVEFD